MEITAAMVKELREKTAAGMMDCKKALVECGGDMDKAVDYLRTKGLAAAAKKAHRSTNEGVVAAWTDAGQTLGVLVEINCETDFVARNEKFRELGANLAYHVGQAAPAYVRCEDAPAGAHAAQQCLMDQPYVHDAKLAVKDYVAASIAVIGENIVVRRFARLEAAAGGFFASYIHSNHKLGVLVEIAGAAGDAAHEAGRNVAMQVAAANPRWVRREDVPADVLEHERVIFREQMKESGKPAQVIEKIVEGKLDKFFKENCLVEQIYIRDDKLTVKAYLESLHPAAGALDVRRFSRLQVGEE